ncbi:MAG TPA: S8 family serine peptidase [Bacteroidia bacterium]
MKRTLTLAFLLLIGTTTFAYDHYWIQFTDKNNTPFSIGNPSAFLSARSIQRRQNQNIPITVRDLPVDPNYVAQVLGTGAVTLNYRSRWFNAISITTTDANALTAINSLPFVVSVQPVKRYRGHNTVETIDNPETMSNQKYSNDIIMPTALNYGQSYNQANQIGAVCLHNAGFQGQGMVIAVLDDGFYNVDILPAFDSLRLNNRLLGTWDFVSGNANVYDDDTHGMEVLSDMAGWIDGSLIGTAPRAQYWLLRTEDAATEYLVEEDNWVAGIEFADSVGADVVNTSLGYTQFDDVAMNHVYADLDGNTTVIARAADFGCAAGMFICCCAGNSGTQPWYYIWSPADADSILAVGAVDNSGVIAGFSSHGPTADGRIKPNTCARGSGATVAASSGGITTASGTSFASPITCGAVACLWQAHPNFTNMQLFNAIQQSANNYSTPDNTYGYGIPDFCAANILLSSQNGPVPGSDQLLASFPDPFTSEVDFSFYSASDQQLKVELMDVTGRIVSTQSFFVKANAENKMELNGLQELSSGVYLLRVSSAAKVFVRKMVKR